MTTPQPEKKTDVHTEHCCIDHGCKYGDDNCTIVTGTKVQSYPCEECEFELKIQLYTLHLADRMSCCADSNTNIICTSDTYDEVLLDSEFLSDYSIYFGAGITGRSVPNPHSSGCIEFTIQYVDYCDEFCEVSATLVPVRSFI